MRPVFPRHATLRLLVLASLSAGPVALAQQVPPSSSHPCQADVARLCADAKQQGHAAVHACMQQHADQLSAECKAHIAEREQRFEAAREACQPDVARLCADVTPGGHRIAACLRAHASELSQACQAAVGPGHGA